MKIKIYLLVFTILGFASNSFSAERVGIQHNDLKNQKKQIRQSAVGIKKDTRDIRDTRDTRDTRDIKSTLYDARGYRGANLKSTFCQGHRLACSGANIWCLSHKCTLTIEQYCKARPSYKDCSGSVR
ncbi:MAG: hypothetical protein Q8R24_01810 [Legionellaceae bacterium]|nr:hypothetical protein [Legionellaceae bacterium]